MGTPMTTRKKRLQVTIEPELEPILERLSIVMNRPKASLVTDMLMSALPTLIETAEVLEKAQRVKSNLDFNEFADKLVSDAHERVNSISDGFKKPI